MTRTMWCVACVFVGILVYSAVGSLTASLLTDAELTAWNVFVPGSLLGAVVATLSFFACQWIGLRFPKLDMESTAVPSKRVLQGGGVLLFAIAVAGAVGSRKEAQHVDDSRLAAVAANDQARAAMTPAELAAKQADFARRSAEGEAAARRLQAEASAAAAHPREQATIPTVSDASRFAWKLAVIDEAGNRNISASVLQAYGSVVDRLVTKCPEAEVRICDLAVVGSQALRDKGVAMSNLEFLEAMDKSMPADVKAKVGVKCAEVAAVLMTMVDRK